MSGKDEAELARLMQAAIAGDERAYADFLGRVAVLVRGFCRNRIASANIDPEDIVQETLLAIHLKRHTWRRDDLISPWIYGIARFKLADAFRQRGRHINIDIADIAEPAAEPAAETLSEHEIEHVLNVLPSGQKAVVSSISVEGWSIGETAAKLDMSETAVRVALHRGLAAISKRFGRH